MLEHPTGLPARLATGLQPYKAVAIGKTLGLLIKRHELGKHDGIVLQHNDGSIKLDASLPQQIMAGKAAQLRQSQGGIRTPPPRALSVVVSAEQRVIW